MSSRIRTSPRCSPRRCGSQSAADPGGDPAADGHHHPARWSTSQLDPARRRVAGGKRHRSAAADGPSSDEPLGDDHHHPVAADLRPVHREHLGPHADDPQSPRLPPRQHPPVVYAGPRPRPVERPQPGHVAARPRPGPAGVPRAQQSQRPRRGRPLEARHRRAKTHRCRRTHRTRRGRGRAEPRPDLLAREDRDHAHRRRRDRRSDQHEQGEAQVHSCLPTGSAAAASSAVHRRPEKALRS